MRRRIFTIVQPARKQGQDLVSSFYDNLITVIALVSMIPLMFKRSNQLFVWIDLFAMYVLFIDYIFRWMTCDYQEDKEGIWPFICYPFGPMAIIDLLALLPSIGILHSGFYMLRLFRILRITKLRHYSASFMHILNAFKKERDIMASCMAIAIFYIFLTALLIFNCEGETFNSFFDALYWASITLTTVGYGDFYPVTRIGRTISMISSIFGIAIIALPAGVITASFVEEIQNARQTTPQIEEDEDRRESILKQVLKIRLYHKLLLDKGDAVIKKLQKHRFTTKELLDLYLQEKEKVLHEHPVCYGTEKRTGFAVVRKKIKRDIHICKSLWRNSRRRKIFMHWLMHNIKFHYAVIMLFCVMLNFTLHQLVEYRDLPLWLDTTGTILAAVLLEPAAGIVVGLINNCQLAIFVSGKSAILYFAVSAWEAVIAGNILRKNKKIYLTGKRIFFSFVSMIVLCSWLSEIINLMRYSYMPNTDAEIYFYWKFIDVDMQPFFAGLFSVGIIKCLDIFVSMGIALGLCFLILYVARKLWRIGI